jgi:hypothetical protein
MDSIREIDHQSAGNCCWYALGDTEDRTGATDDLQQDRITNDLEEGNQQPEKPSSSTSHVTLSHSGVRKSSCAIDGGPKMAARLRKASIAMTSGAADVPDDSLMTLRAPFKLCRMTKLAELPDESGSTAKRSDKVRSVDVHFSTIITIERARRIL